MGILDLFFVFKKTRLVQGIFLVESIQYQLLGFGRRLGRNCVLFAVEGSLAEHDARVRAARQEAAIEAAEGAARTLEAVQASLEEAGGTDVGAADCALDSLLRPSRSRN